MLAFLEAYSPPAFHASVCAPRVLCVSIRLMKSDGAILITIISWNLVFDDFLKMYDNSAIKSIGFADDGTLLITGICIKTIYDIMQKAQQRAENWAAENGLKFCPKKTNSILFTRKHIKIASLPRVRAAGAQREGDEDVWSRH
jgi:hypothetical protein